MSPSRSFARSRVMSIDILSGKVFEPTETAAVPAPQQAHVIVRLHDHPIGDIDVARHDYESILDDVRKTAWSELHDSIVYHLQSDGIAAPDSLDDLLALDAACSRPLDTAPKDPPFFTVAIPTVDNETSCIRTVRRILESSYPNFEVVVIDNSPTDTDLEDLLEKEISNPRVRYSQERRIGASFARNRGIELANGEIVVFTDDDVIVDDTWLFAIAHAFDADSKVACVTGAIMTAEIETPAQAWLEQYGGYNKGFRMQRFDLDENRRDTALYPYDAGQFGSGANIAIRAAVLRELGGFDIALGPGTPSRGGEDIDLLRRVVSSKHRLVYEPSSLLWHYHRRSYAALRKLMYSYGVGLSATVTKWMLESPGTAFSVIRRLPAGARHIFSPTSRKNARKSAYYPRQLTWLERAGLAVGPFLYLKSRSTARSQKSPDDSRSKELDN